LCRSVPRRRSFPRSILRCRRRRSYHPARPRRRHRCLSTPQQTGRRRANALPLHATDCRPAKAGIADNRQPHWQRNQQLHDGRTDEDPPNRVRHAEQVHGGQHRDDHVARDADQQPHVRSRSSPITAAIIGGTNTIISGMCPSHHPDQRDPANEPASAIARNQHHRQRAAKKRPA
jgi:hypothetical protein